jgi:hypothetical protein
VLRRLRVRLVLLALLRLLVRLVLLSVRRLRVLLRVLLSVGRLRVLPRVLRGGRVLRVGPRLLRLPVVARLRLPAAVRRAPGATPRPAAGRTGTRGSRALARAPGLAALGGQHDTFVRGPRRRKVRLLTLSALRHRDSYVCTYGIVGSRYRVTPGPRTRVWRQ